MKSWEAMRRCIAGRTRRLAGRLRLSPSLVGKWQEPSAGTFSGCLNPLDRIKDCIDDAIAHGMPEEEALAPLDYLEECYSRVGVRVPDAGIPVTGEDLTRELARTINEFGHLTAEASEAIGAGRVRRNRVERIGRRAWGAARQTLSFLFKVEKAAGARSRREAA